MGAMALAAGAVTSPAPDRSRVPAFSGALCVGVEAIAELVPLRPGRIATDGAHLSAALRGRDQRQRPEIGQDRLRPASGPHRLPGPRCAGALRRPEAPPGDDLALRPHWEIPRHCDDRMSASEPARRGQLTGRSRELPDKGRRCEVIAFRHLLDFLSLAGTDKNKPPYRCGSRPPPPAPAGGGARTLRERIEGVHHDLSEHKSSSLDAWSTDRKVPGSTWNCTYRIRCRGSQAFEARPLARQLVWRCLSPGA